MMKLKTIRSRIAWANLSYWLAWLALIASLLYLIAAYSPGRAHYSTLYNGDAMFIPLFFRDMMAGGKLAAWDLPTSPFFFPEMLLFFSTLAIFPEIHLAAISYAFLQLLAVITGILLVQRQLFGARSFVQLLSLLTLTLCMLLIATGKQAFYPFALMSGEHFGSVVVIPFATMALLVALQPERTLSARRVATWLLFALTLLAALSETLFIVQFVLPACIAILIWGLRWGKDERIRWRQLFMLDVGLLLAAAAGQSLRLFLVPVDKIFHYTNTKSEAQFAAWANFASWLDQDILTDPLLIAFWLVSVAALIAVIIVCPHLQEVRPIALVASLYLGSVVIPIVAALISGNFLDSFSTRYFLSAIYLPLMAGLPLLLALWLSLEQKPQATRRVNVAASICSLLAIGYILFTFQPLTFASISTYQDPLMACLERETARLQIRYGIASYWQANTITALSEGDLQVVAAWENLAPYFWGNSRAWYHAPLDFVIMDSNAPTKWRLHPDFVTERFGEPADRFTCESSEVFVYNRQSDVAIRNWFANRPEFAELEQVGDEGEFFGYALPSANGAIAAGLSLGASDEGGHHAGTMAYASFPALTEGSYALAFDLYADSANIGLWEVIEQGGEKPVILATQPITATGKSLETGYFTLSQRSDVEIRVNYDGHGALFLDNMRIARIDPAQAASFDFAPAPMPTAAAQGMLTLIHPAPGTHIANGNVDFAWRWTGQPLPKEQSFEVRLWHKGESIHYGAHDAMTSKSSIRQIGDTYILRLDLNGAHSVIQHRAGKYEWSVAIVAIEPAYQDLQIEATSYPLRVLP